jgi:hypothetical protein
MVLEGNPAKGNIRVAGGKETKLTQLPASGFWLLAGSWQQEAVITIP